MEVFKGITILLLTENVINSVLTYNLALSTPPLCSRHTEEARTVSGKSLEVDAFVTDQYLATKIKFLETTESSSNYDEHAFTTGGVTNSTQMATQQEPNCTKADSNDTKTSLPCWIQEPIDTTREIGVKDAFSQNRSKERDYKNDRSIEGLVTSQADSSNREEFATVRVNTIPSTPFGFSAGLSLDQRLEFTCRGRCGQRIALPCGCSASCVVYGTCCRDMSHDCPQIVQEGHARFGHLLTSDVICDEALIYRIVSCPLLNKKQESPQQIDSPMLEQNHNSNLLNSLLNQSGQDSTQSPSSFTLLSRISPQSDDRLKAKIIERLNKALVFSAPITDTNSGFTFVNKSIYDCHNMPNASPVTWSLRLDYSFETPSSLEDLVPLLRADNRYTPMFNQQILIPHLCQRDVVRTCKGSRDEDFKEKCQNSTAIVYSNLEMPLYYANQFCAYCNEGRHYGLRLLEANQVLIKSIDLHLLMSLSTDGVYKLKTVKGTSRITLSWVGAQCTIPEAPAEKKASPEHGDKTCVVQCEGKDFTRRPDGMCKAPHSALFAIDEDGLTPFCPAVVSRFANFVSCGLKLLSVGMKNADFHTPTVSILLDPRIKKTLYVATLYMDLINLPNNMLMSDLFKDFLKNFNSLAILAKSFKDLRSSHDPCVRREDETELASLNDATINLKSLDDALGMYLYNETKELHWVAADKQNASTMCASTFFVHKNETFPIKPFYLLICANVSDFELSAEIKQVLRGSKCFDYLKASPPLNNGRPSWRLTNIPAYMSIVTCHIATMLFLYRHSF
ncbi:hypothetical protein RRG08_016038 [Elysia crispata]|uniref:SMB domain-containing protein n=1 Tax=Elysia crispata TaxID=231223 RepID=A0AAE0XZV2_9GAST|nr:hypothetical protein RRG08_016038 [Elysia crispata]